MVDEFGRTMGDRCYSALTCNKKHIKIFIDIGYYKEGEETDNAVSMAEDEANYGNYEDLNGLEGKGIPFYGYHGEGGCYGASRFASDGREIAWLQCDHEGFLVVRFDEDKLDIESGDVDQARHYVEVEKRAKEYCRTDPDELASYGNPIPTAADKKIVSKRRRNDKQG